jgi:hypothetical protein
MAFWAQSQILDAVMTNQDNEWNVLTGELGIVYTYVDDGGLRVGEYDAFGLCGPVQPSEIA